MKTKKLTRKLTLKKSTIADLAIQEKNDVKGGYLNTNLEATCYTWCGVCLTRASCVPTCYYSCYCDTELHYTCLRCP
jgi:hypothetical protein